MFTKESIKQFLKLNLWKILLFLIIFIPLNSLVKRDYIDYGSDYYSCQKYARCEPVWRVDNVIGFPFVYSEDFYDFTGQFFDYRTINYLNLIFNLVFWYFISCFLLFILDKIKTKKLKT